MKIISFVGSPRKQGNTSELVKQVLSGASSLGAEVKTFYINDFKLKGCQGCDYCKKCYC